MPRSLAVHWNPPSTKGKARCGFWLNKVKHTGDIKDVTCDRCLMCIEADSR